MKPGDRVALLCHNCPHYIAAYFGIIRGGGIVLPLNNLLTAEEIDFILNDAGVQICLFDPDCAETAEKLARPDGRSFFTLSELAHAPPRRTPSSAPIRPTTSRRFSTPRAPRAGPRERC